MSKDLRLGLITSLNSDFDYKEFNLNLNFVHILISISHLYPKIFLQRILLF